MYNLTVAIAHTFFVGEEQWLVHNAPRCLLYKLYDIVPYKESLTDLNNVLRQQGLATFEKHHALLSQWAKVHITGYDHKEAPSLILTVAQHKVTKDVYMDWLEAKTTRRVGVSPDWQSVSASEIQQLTYDMLDAAGVPTDVQQNYMRELHKYLYQ